jgi:acetoacetate decarboxylase
MTSQSNYCIPQVAPLYEAPPYEYKAYRKVSVFCRVDQEEIRRALPLVFELRGDVLEFFIMDVPHGGALGAYREGGIVVPMSYRGRPGGHVLYEIVTSDDSMAVGREVWGYPKKMGSVEWSDDGLSVEASLSRRGAELIKIKFEAQNSEFSRPNLHPRFQTRIVPSPAGPFANIDIIENALGNASIKTRVAGKSLLTLGGTPSDPFSNFTVLEIIGSEFVVADFSLGFGRIAD